MANEAAKTQTINIVPVQGIFQPEPTFALISLIGPAGTPFYPIIDPNESGLNITSSTINSTTIGATTPSTGVFTNISTTTGQVTTTPSANTDIANKFYVDTVAQGLGPKAACAAATLTSITLSGLQSIDSYTTLAGDRVLVKNQSTSSENGIYIASASAWTRSTDMDVWSEVPGAYTVILNGGQANTGWVCTATATGTIGVTAMPWVQFSGTNTYFAGTGLTLAANTFSITNTGVTAASVGSASKTLTATVNAQGQLTALADTNIAISNSQVSGLGTMSTQNANSVAITGGSIDGTTIGGSTAAAVTGTIITASNYFSGAGTNLTGTASGLSIGGNAATATSAGSVTNSLTINSSGSGGTSPQTYNGGAAVTVSYNTVGAPSITGTNASGTWGISISGNSATVTNGLYSTGSYSNPTWLTSISGSIVSGAVASATTATNVAGGATGSLVYQSAAATTTTLALGTTNYVLTAGASAPQYVAQSTLSVGSATTATTATNLAGGNAGSIPYQSGAGATAFLAFGTTGQVLTSNGTSAPTWTTPASYATVTDDTTTAGTRYPLFANQTTGNLSTEYVSSTKLQFNPSTGVFTATGFSGSGASLTSLTAGNLSGTIPSAVLGNSTVYIGTTAVALNRASASISLTGTNIDGSAGSATTATTATNATNIAITDNTTSATTWYPVISTASSGNNPATTSSTKLSFVPSTSTLIATNFAGLASSATNIAGGANLQIPYNTGAGATSFIAAPTIASTFLQYNGTGFVWAASAGVGTVTSVGQTFTGGLISVSGSPITTAGTLALTVAGTSGGIPYFSSSSTWATSAALAANALVIGGGAGAAPATTTTGTGVVTALGVNTGTAGAFVVNGGVLGTPSSGTLTNCTFPTLNQNTSGSSGSCTGNAATATALSTASGSAPSYSARAWANWDGTSASPSTIRASANVSSITKNGTGDYTVNFTTAMSDANYSAVGMSSRNGSGQQVMLIGWSGSAYYAPTSSTIRVQTYFPTSGLVDSLYNFISIFR
jgi:hypothetical protein